MQGGDPRCLEDHPHEPFDFPWLREIPERLQEQLRWRPAEEPVLPDQDLIILLYVGKQDASALDSVLATRQRVLDATIVALDVLRKDSAVGQDVLQDQPFGELCRACSLRRVRFVGGGGKLSHLEHLQVVSQTGLSPAGAGTIRD